MDTKERVEGSREEGNGSAWLVPSSGETFRNLRGKPIPKRGKGLLAVQGPSSPGHCWRPDPRIKGNISEPVFLTTALGSVGGLKHIFWVCLEVVWMSGWPLGGVWAVVGPTASQRWPKANSWTIMDPLGFGKVDWSFWAVVEPLDLPIARDLAWSTQAGARWIGSRDSWSRRKAGEWGVAQGVGLYM